MPLRTTWVHPYFCFSSDFPKLDQELKKVEKSYFILLLIMLL